MLEVLRKLAKKKAPPPICSAVIVAAGSARRMEGIDKVLAPLGELPVLVHTIYSFQDCPRFDEIVVVTREDLLVEVSRICKDFQLDKVSKVVVGGRERTDSVLAGLREVRPDADLIAIHDGARPLAPQQVLEEVVERAAETGAAAPAIPRPGQLHQSHRCGAVVDENQIVGVPGTAGQEKQQQGGQKQPLHGFSSSPDTYSKMSPGWQSRARQMASRVVKRTALA